MTNKLITILKSISSFLSNNKKEMEVIEPEPVKHYTFLLKAETDDVKMNINIVAGDKSEAEQKVRELYPEYKENFLWEYKRRTAADLHP